MGTLEWVRLVIALLATAVVLVFAAKRVLWLVTLIRSGQPVADEAGRKDHMGDRITNQIKEVFAQTKLLKWSIPGIAHFFTMWGFFILASVYLEAYGVLFNPEFHIPIIGRWDTLRLEQVITNLLANAIKYGLGKPIEVSVRGEEGCGVLCVRDQGIGIAEADQGRVFERFERIVTGRNYGGFGLGLWIVREILEAHGGTIEVQSALGVGSTFTVTLPTARPAPGDRARRPAVMLVDDDAMIRETFQGVVEDEGFSVLTAGNGAEALALLREGARPGIIFLDLMMPVLDGAGFCAAYKRRASS